jgi:hypothetical protein
MDRNISEYRVKIRNNKWWWQIFTHLLSASLSNAWLLYCMQIAAQATSTADDAPNAPGHHESPKLDLLGFTRNVSSALLLLSDTDRSLPGRPHASVKTVLVRKIPDSVRRNTDALHHPINMKQGRCKVCQKNSTLGCGICRLNMHAIDCFKTFHEFEQSKD